MDCRPRGGHAAHQAPPAIPPGIPYQAAVGLLLSAVGGELVTGAAIDPLQCPGGCEAVPLARSTMALIGSS